MRLTAAQAVLLRSWGDQLLDVLLTALAEPRTYVSANELCTVVAELPPLEEGPWLELLARLERWEATTSLVLPTRPSIRLKAILGHA